MPVQLSEKRDGKIIEVRVNGKLTAKDYKKFTPKVERAIKRHRKIRILVDMHDFHGWQASALWEDIKFGLEHFSDIERLAMVGETKWQAGMSAFCKPFTSAEIRYFDRAEATNARDWIEADLVISSPPSSESPHAGQQKLATVA